MEAQPGEKEGVDTEGATLLTGHPAFRRCLQNGETCSSAAAAPTAWRRGYGVTERGVLQVHAGENA